MNATVTSRLPDWTVWLTAKRYKVFLIQVSLHENNKINFFFSSCQKVRAEFNFISELNVLVYLERTFVSESILYFKSVQVFPNWAK
jgi:hypothetical protein